MVQRMLLRFFDWLYTDLAWAYDGVAWLASGGLWYRWTYVAEEFVGQEPIAEVGIGKGRLLARLSAHHRPVVGVDRSAQMLRAAAARTAAPLVRADGRLLPFPDHAFGTIVTTFPATYVKEERTQREFARVLRPGGRWVWVDAPAPRAPTLRLTLLTLFNRILMACPGHRRAGQGVPALAPGDVPLSFPAFDVERTTVPVGPTEVTVLVLKKR